MDDLGVSRQQGKLTYEGDRWWLRNTGCLPIQLPSRLVLRNTEHPLDEGTTVLVVRGSANRVHMMELYVVGTDATPREQVAADTPEQDLSWPLTREERLALAALSQRYLHDAPRAQPLAWRQAAELVAGADPDGRWTAKRVEHVVSNVRSRLSRRGVAGLTSVEVGEPAGNALKHNLYKLRWDRRVDLKLSGRKVIG